MAYIRGRVCGDGVGMDLGPAKEVDIRGEGLGICAIGDGESFRGCCCFIETLSPA